MVGYVLKLSPTKKSMNDTRNEYFDMKFQCGEDRVKRIDKKNASQPKKLRNKATFFNRDSSVENTSSHECKFSKQDIKECESKISDVLKCKDGIFNIRGKLIWQSDIRSPSSCSQSVRDAVITDATGSIAISIWEEHFTKVKENSFYYITNTKTQNFKDIPLTTQRFTTFVNQSPLK